MKKLRMLLVASVLTAAAAIAGPAVPAQAASCEDGGAGCTIWQSPICKEQLPKAVRVAAGCFTNQP